MSQRSLAKASSSTSTTTSRAQPECSQAQLASPKRRSHTTPTATSLARLAVHQSQSRAYLMPALQSTADSPSREGNQALVAGRYQGAYSRRVTRCIMTVWLGLLFTQSSSFGSRSIRSELRGIAVTLAIIAIIDLWFSWRLEVNAPLPPMSKQRENDPPKKSRPRQDRRPRQTAQSSR